MIGKCVKTSLWGYVPSLDGQDAEKDYDGDVIGVVESVTPYNPNVFRIKIVLYRPNVKDATWTADLKKIGGGCFMSTCNFKDGYLEEWNHNLKVL